MTEELLERIRSLREAGNVKRVHTIPAVGDITYTVASHSWNAISLLYTLHPDPSHDLVKALLWHDCAERWMGDLPSPAKIYNPELKASYEAVEEAVLKATKLSVPIDEEDTNWLKSIDTLEFWLWCEDQQNMGNKNVINAQDQVFAILASEDWIPTPVKQFVYAYHARRGMEIWELP